MLIVYKTKPKNKKMSLVVIFVSLVLSNIKRLELMFSWDEYVVESRVLANLLSYLWQITTKNKTNSNKNNYRMITRMNHTKNS